jgi:membrane-bound serine protease (ClpP class)
LKHPPLAVRRIATAFALMIVSIGAFTVLRAASAGVWISEAGDVLAMSPVSNIGSSTPINSGGGNIGSDLRRKVINDAAASLRSLAATHKRNTTWPVLAVTKASNLTAQQALRLHVMPRASSRRAND